MPQRATITDISLRAAKPPESGSSTIWDGAMRNFGVRISSGGTKSFVILLGQGRRQVIGRYPTITLSQARDKAIKIFAEKTLGRHAPSTVSWQAARDEFLTQVRQENRPRTYRDYKRILTTYFPFTGKLTDITKLQIARKLDLLRDTPCQRNNTLVCGKIFFRWCVERGYLDHNPMIGQYPQKQPQRSRVLTDAELRKVWKAAGQLGAFGTIVKLLILTGQRRTEIGSLHSSWIKTDAITLTPEITKNGREHTFPIGACSATLLTETMKKQTPVSGYIFSARTGSSGLCFSGWSRGKANLDKVSGVADWILHDLRRTFATIHARIGTPIAVIEKLLNHTSGTFSGIVAVYQHHSFMPEMRAAVTAYEDYLRRNILSNPEHIHQLRCGSELL